MNFRPIIRPLLIELGSLACGLLFLILVLPDFARAQPMDSTARTDSLKRTSHSIKPPDRLWLMVAGSLDLVTPNLGSADNVFGYAYRLGAIWHNMILLFTNHNTRYEYSFGTPIEEHRYDYALLFGLSHRDEILFLSVGAGVSMVKYLLRGNLVTDDPHAKDAIYQQQSGTGFGPAIMASIYFTPNTKYGGGGIGLYKSLAKGVSYFALEMTLFVTVPIVLSK